MSKIIFVAIPLLAFMLVGCAPSADPETESFAECLNQKGAVLYVSSTCPRCHTQREMFGPAENALAMVNCSTDRQTCTDQEISGVPTWIFADGTRRSGVQPLASLAAKTGCTLPEKAPTAGSNQPL